jgi:hypothetical protein
MDEENSGVSSIYNVNSQNDGKHDTLQYLCGDSFSIAIANSCEVIERIIMKN